MSEFDLARQEMAVELLGVFGVDATYTFEDTTTKNIKVRVSENVEIVDADSGVSLIDRVLGIDPIDIPSPKRGEQVTIGIKTYRVGRDIGARGGLNRYQAT